jgi:hypothetical protein
MSSPLHLRPSTILFLILLSATGLTRLAGQGSPPMITDDPETPGDGHWEINLGWTDQRTAGSTLMGLPLLDANYGLGDNFQLTYEAPWAIVKDEAGTRTGVGDSLLGAKWRFYHAGEDGWQASVFPQVSFLNPGSQADRRGLAEADTTLLLPFEVERKFGPVGVDAEVGHVFSSRSGEDSWMGGIVLGHEIAKGWELDAEVHVNASNQLDRTEWILNGGAQIDLSEHITLLLSLGRDVRNQLGPRASLLSYLGLQFRF